jgi:beta-lactamase regulating signal transducer with metallopeptidase domain
MHAVLAISKCLKMTRPVRVLQSGNAVAMRVSWGIFRPVIILPALAPEWSEKRRRIVLSHELSHIARGDWFLQICAENSAGLLFGSIRSLGSQRDACAKRVNALAMILF